MNIRQVLTNETLPIGSKVIHNSTKEIGIIVGECFGYGKCKVVYKENEMWYPQPKQNISLIL